MRSILSIVCTFLLLGTIASAWPWSNYGEALGNALLDRRDDTTSSESASTSEQTTSVASQTSTDSSSDITTASDTKTASDETETGTSTGTNTKSNTKTTATSSISINPADGAGGISMLTPAATSTTYYHIGQNITFVWNYTSLVVKPTAVDVVASCSLNSATYTVTQNMSMEATGTVIWDTGKYEKSATIPLLTATYTLFVYDSEKSLSDTASAGHLGSNIGYSFGMYYPHTPTALPSFQCVTCNGGLSEVHRQGLKFVFGMAGITLLSFSWFAGTFGLFSL